VLASSEKLLAASPFLVTECNNISLLLVPKSTPQRIVRMLRAAGPKVERVPQRVPQRVRHHARR
jgi:hypothetical protein